MFQCSTPRAIVARELSENVRNNDVSLDDSVFLSDSASKNDRRDKCCNAELISDSAVPVAHSSRQNGRLRSQSFGGFPLPSLLSVEEINARRASNISGCAVCRICHGSEMSSPVCVQKHNKVGQQRGEPLISPCFCRGTMGLYHRSCLEQWLSTSNTSCCEICKFEYITERKPKPFTAFIQQPGSSLVRRHLIGDCLCYFILTPLAVVSTYLCISGAIWYGENAPSNSSELPGLVCLAVFLMLTYLVWFVISFRYHYKIYQKWCLVNHYVRVYDKEERTKGGTPRSALRSKQTSPLQNASLRIEVAGENAAVRNQSSTNTRRVNAQFLAASSSSSAATRSTVYNSPWSATSVNIWARHYLPTPTIVSPNSILETMV